MTVCIATSSVILVAQSSRLAAQDQPDLKRSNSRNLFSSPFHGGVNMKRYQQWFQDLPEHVRTVLRASPAIAVFLFSWVCASRTAPLTCVMIATGSAACIATFQLLNRSPLLNRQIATWLRQMNWDGQVRSLPFGGACSAV